MPGATNELMFRLLGVINKYFFTPSVIKPKLPPGETIRFGLISAALINPPAILYPSQHFPEVEIIAIATRDKNHAIEYAKRWGIKEEKAYEGYQALLDDKDVDAVFIGLPNGLHAEWAIKALQAGKHVLVEKPSTSNAIEAREIQSVLQSLTITPKPVFLEAFHYRFHPATVFVRGLLSSGTYGKIQNTYAFLGVPSSGLDPKNIRFNFDLGGGALMDLTYTLSVTRYMLLGPGAGKPREIVSANAKKLPTDDRVDIAMEAEMIFDVDDGNGGTSEVRSKILSDLAVPDLFGFIPKIWQQPVFVAECEKATITYNNFAGPYLSHSIIIKNKADGKCRSQKVYSFDPTNKTPLLSTYGHQLDTFVKKVKGRDSDIAADWIPIEDTVAQMEVIDEIYQKAGMPIRNGSLYAEILRRGGQ